MVKERTTISIDADIFREARNKGLNISGVCEESLKTILITYQQSIPQDNCEHKFTSAFCTPYGLAKECLKCGMIKKVFIETFEETKKKYDKYDEIIKAKENDIQNL